MQLYILKCLCVSGLFLPFKQKADATAYPIEFVADELFLPFKQKADATLEALGYRVLVLFLPFKQKADATGMQGQKNL